MPEFEFDVFISHASEDKDAFVRPLVEALSDRHLTVWYDETELKPGDRLIQSIERGLSRSRFGLLVISSAFIRRPWPRAEVDALSNREFMTGESVLIPVWLDVGQAEVYEFSPLLADRVAIRNGSIERVADQVVQAIRLGGSPVVLAREMLAEYGLTTPPPADSWWLDQIEFAGERAGESDIESPPTWDRWEFPLVGGSSPTESLIPNNERRSALETTRDAFTWKSAEKAKTVASTVWEPFDVGAIAPKSRHDAIRRIRATHRRRGANRQFLGLDDLELNELLKSGQIEATGEHFRATKALRFSLGEAERTDEMEVRARQTHNLVRLLERDPRLKDHL